MRMNMHTKKPLKKSVNLSIDAELLKDSRDAGINLSQVLEEALRKKRVEEFKASIAPGLAHLNKRLEEEGLWSDGMRTW
jgi:antitoxin CcdA